jgi:hypothetical protein
MNPINGRKLLQCTEKINKINKKRHKGKKLKFNETTVNKLYLDSCSNLATNNFRCAMLMNIQITFF